MVTHPTPEQHQLFATIENRVKWEVAEAYRDGMLQEIGEANARWAAIRTMERYHPEIDMERLQALVAYIIVRAAQQHKEWMQGYARRRHRRLRA